MDAPTKGNDYLLQADYKINRATYFVNKKIPKNSWVKDCLSNSILQRKIENWSKLNKNK